MESPLPTSQVLEMRWVLRVYALLFIVAAFFMEITPEWCWRTLGGVGDNNSLIQYLGWLIAISGITLFYAAQSANDPGIKRIIFLIILLNFGLIYQDFEIDNQKHLSIFFSDGIFNILTNLFLIYFFIRARIKLKLGKN